MNRLRRDSDTVAAFLGEKTETDPDGRVKKFDLYRSYEAFCMDMERQSLTKQNFYRSMKAKGFSEIKTNENLYFKGIKYLKNIPNTSLKHPCQDFMDVPDEDIPFD